MVSLFLVEDEKIARESIRKNVAWAEHDITYLGDAPDGELALPQILEKQPDILLTDIKMPFMDGLELSKVVRTRLPGTRIILLSGYDEFDYARQAISIGISEYLLKPVSSTDILRSVEKVRREIEAQREQQRSQQARQNLHRDALHQLFFSGLFSGTLAGAGQILERAETLGIALHGPCYQVVVLRFDTADAPLSCLLCPPDGILAAAASAHEAACLLQGADENALTAQCACLKEWGTAQAARYGQKIALFCGQVVYRLQDICASFQRAHSPRLQLGTDDATDFSGSAAFDRETMLEFLRTGQAAMAGSYWQRSAAIGPALGSAIYRCYLCAEIFFVADRFAQEAGLTLPPQIAGPEQLEAAALQYDTPEAFHGFLCAICTDLIGQRDKKYPGRLLPIAVQAKEYIDAHYMDAQLSLGTVAEAVCVSPNYLSTIFKEKTGSNFSEYLTGVRIRRAETLLTASGLRASEVAARVGYQNFNYFSMTFKKITGMSPTKYQAEKRLV